MNNVSKLAIEGGRPIRNHPLPVWPTFSKTMIQAVSKVLQSGQVNYWTGNQGKRFEQEFSDYIGVKYAIAVSNGTFALEAALRSLDIKAGDEVIVPSKTFIATATAVLTVGAKPVFSDIDLMTENITSQLIKSLITPKTKAIIVVHLAGLPCDMNPILKLAKKNKIKVIEDCAQAHGAKYKGKQIGSWGDIATFSFCQDKIITTGGEGGIVVTNSKGLFKNIWSYKDHGRAYNLPKKENPTHSFQFIHKTLGTNGRMTEMQAVLGRLMLKALDQLVIKRRSISNRLTMSINKLAIFEAKPELGTKFYHAYYRYHFTLNPNQLKKGWNRARIIRSINAEGIKIGTGICNEIYLEDVFEEKIKPKKRLPNASLLAQTSLYLPLNPNYSNKDIQDIINVLNKVAYYATR